MNIKLGSRLGICMAAITLSALGGAAFQILAAGGAKGTATSTANNLRQPVANTSGLVAWYPLDGDAKDYSGNHYDATVTNSTYDGTTNGWTGGKFGKGLLFNGSNNYLDAGNSVPMKLNTGTVSAWIKTGNAGSGYRAIAVKQSAYSLLLLDNVFIIYNWGPTGGVGYKSTGISLADNNWHQVTATFQSGVVNGTLLYVDGVLKLTTTMEVASQDFDSFLIGANGSNPQNFNGSIDDVRLYSKVLTAADISKLYGGSAPTNCDQTCRVWLKLDDNTGTTASDATGSGNAGTLSGTTAWTSGNFASAINLDGSTGYVSLPNLAMTAGTVDMWINPASVSGDQRLFAQLSGAGTQAGQIALNQSSGESGSLWVWDGAAWQRLAPDGAVRAGVWNQVVVANNGGTVTAYVNGTQQLTAAAAFAFSGPTAGIGAKFLGMTGGTFNGSVDDFRVYSRMLAPEEVTDQWRLGT